LQAKKTNGDYFLLKGMQLSDSLFICIIDQSIIYENKGTKFDIDIVFNTGIGAD
jgi:hypothetical protein